MIDNEKQDPFQLVSVIVMFNMVCFHISVISTKNVFLHFEFLQANFRVKRATILWRAPGGT